MSQVAEHVSINELRSLSPFCEIDLEESQLRQLARTAKVEEFPKGARIIELGTRDNWTFYLLDGLLQLEATDGKKTVIEKGTVTATHPIARLLPRRYHVTSLTPARMLKLDTARLESFVKMHMGDHGDEPDTLCYHVYESTNSQLDVKTLLFEEIQQEIEEDTLELPSLPEVAVKIREHLDNDKVSMEHLARLIQTDSAISAKLVKAANSALYAGQSHVDSVAKAIIRMGLKTTGQLVLSFALSGLFRSGFRELKQRMQAVWQHSSHVAAISFVMAKKVPGFDPERALLAGLLHDIGEIPILSYAQKYPELLTTPDALDSVVKELRGPVGCLVLQAWNFPEDFVSVAKEVDDWFRNPPATADYCDLVIVAQAHSQLANRGPLGAGLPPLNLLPAFTKLSLGEWTPETSFEFLESAKDQINDTMSLLS
jgi:HD-like signal output (HDOD) protein